MVKLITTFLFAIVVFISNAQVQTEKTYDSYLEQYKFSKRKANKLAIIGGSGVAAGVVLAVIPTKNTYANVGKIIGSVGLIGTGALVSIISIPFYVTASNTKRKTRQLYPEISMLEINGIKYTNIGLKISL